MSEREKADRCWILRTTIIISLMAVYTGSGIYFNMLLHTAIVYTHLAYIPIILAGMWWGRKSILVAVLMAATIFILRSLGIGVGELWSDVARGFFLCGARYGPGPLAQWTMLPQPVAGLIWRNPAGGHGLDPPYNAPITAGA